MEKLIIIGGKATHGKDETSKRIRELLEKQNKKCLNIAVGDSLKYVASKYYGWDGKKDEKGRSILQDAGMIARKNNPEVWSNILNQLILALGPEYDYVFVADVRFPIEIDSLKKLFSTKVKTIRVRRVNYESSLTDEQKNHPTEIALDKYPFDDIIINDTIEGLQETCERYVKRLISNEI